MTREHKVTVSLNDEIGHGHFELGVTAVTIIAQRLDRLSKDVFLK